MAFIRDRDAKTRGVGAVAALDQVSAAGRRQQRARAMNMARRDQRLARIAMGAINMHEGPGRISSTQTGTRFDYGTNPNLKPPPPTGGANGVTTSPTTGRLTPTRAAQKFTQTFSQDITSTRPTSPTVPPLPPPVEVVDTPTPRPQAPSSGGGGSWGGGAGGSSSSSPDIPGVIVDPVPDVVSPGTGSSQLSNRTLAIGAAALVAAYLLTKKKKA